jgi:hypothetical protein
MADIWYTYYIYIHSNQKEDRKVIKSHYSDFHDRSILLDPFGGYYIPIPTIYGQDFDAPTSPLWTKASGRWT